VYDRKLQALARKAAQETNTPMQEGVYVNLSGPSFETPADLRFLRTIGADAVGMSTVPEAIVAVHGHTRVLGLSGISNKASLDGSTITTGEEVLEAGKVLVPKMERIIRHFYATSINLSIGIILAEGMLSVYRAASFVFNLSAGMSMQR
jgi:purine-nucleoside phosphorylase